MSADNKVKEFLNKKFNNHKADAVVSHFSASVQKFVECDWEGTLTKAGKFIEATVKLIWIYSGNILPRPKEFKAGVYAEKIINIKIDSSTLTSDALRLQIPRACIFAYDIASNRGARHDSEEVDPNEMDATIVLSLCSWILAELIRFSTKDFIKPADAKKIVDALTKRRYPSFEDIDGRIYVDHEKFGSARECALLCLYYKYPERMSKEELSTTLKRHGYKKTPVKFERLAPYIDTDNDGNILLRVKGREEAEEILAYRK